MLCVRVSFSVSFKVLVVSVRLRVSVESVCAMFESHVIGESCMYECACV